MNKRLDTAEVKRVELSLHSNNSKLDGVCSVKSVIEQAAAWGHPAIAITDHGTVQGFPDARRYGREYGVKVIYGLDAYYNNDVDGDAADKVYHMTLLVKNRAGLKNLYRLITGSYDTYLHEIPCIRKSALQQHREGLLLGSAGEEGEVFACVAGGDAEKAAALAAFYDYMEVRPVSDSQEPANRQVAALAAKFGKPIAATGNVHYLQQEDRIAQDAMEFLYGERLPKEDDAALFLRTTEEMLEEFDYLGECCTDAVITNPRLIADQCEDIALFAPCRLFAPAIAHSGEEIKRLCTERVEALYGPQPPAFVRERLDWELTNILRNGYDSIYMLNYRLASRAREQGRLALPRMASASLAAYLLGIGSLNPLPPHYRCPACRHTERSDAADCGIDLPEKTCPHCNTPMTKDGCHIPAETFMHLDGSKEPYIDLLFSTEYQSGAEEHLREMFGAERVFRTTRTWPLTGRRAMEDLDIYTWVNEIEVPEEEQYRLAGLLAEVKREESPRPGPFLLLPPEIEAADICPLQRNDRQASQMVSQYEARQLDGAVYAQEIIRSRALTALEYLEKQTGVKGDDIPLDAPEVYQALADRNFEDDFFEFGGWAKQNTLELCKPKTFAELMKISGLARGTGTWKYNAEWLLKKGMAKLGEVVANREDIFLYLQGRGVPRKEAFRLMEATRKGDIKRGRICDHREVLQGYDIPEWYIASLEKIDYLIPKAHSAEYAALAFRFLWYYVHHREEYERAKEMALQKGGM